MKSRQCLSEIYSCIVRLMERLPARYHAGNCIALIDWNEFNVPLSTTWVACVGSCEKNLVGRISSTIMGPHRKSSKSQTIGVPQVFLRL